MKKKVNLNLKEKAREKLLKLNAKIKEMLEKPEFEWEEKQDWEDQLLWSGEKKDIPQKDFLKNINEKTVEILQKHSGFKVKMVLVCRMASSNLAKEQQLKMMHSFLPPWKKFLKERIWRILVKKMNEWMLENMQNFQKGRSNWQFLRVEKLEIHLDEMTVGNLFRFLIGWTLKKH